MRSEERRVRELSEGELLSAYRLRGDQEAFAELVKRFGDMVQKAAGSVVGESYAAEDIAQTTFMTLARKAALIDDRRPLGNWLYGVAVKLAINEVRRRRRRITHENESTTTMQQRNQEASSTNVSVSALHEELAALSERDRLPVILFHFEGRSLAEGAAILGCNTNTFSSWLTRSREKLRKRLVRRGVDWGYPALVAALGQGLSTAELPAAFVASTCKAAHLIAAGKSIEGVVSANVLALNERAMSMLFWAKMKSLAALCAGAALVGGVVFAVTFSLVLQPSVGPVKTADGSAVTGGMVPIPGGMNAGVDPDTQKSYTLTVESFLMDRCEVSKALWGEVAAWGREHGYVFEQNSGQGKAPNHPVHSVSWYDCTLWCNARSEKDGFTPVYCKDAAGAVVLRHSGPVFVRATADGYRLPTLVEWQYAARGGKPSHRFSWHDVETVDHSRANYRSRHGQSLDSGRGWSMYHPLYGVEPWPYTSPVGAFPPNAYGLHDMVGNVNEWCFDGTTRPFRWYAGGSWASLEQQSTVSWCKESPDDGLLMQGRIGFRTVRTP